MKCGNKFFIVITDLYSKLIKAAPTSKTTAAIVARVFVKYWINNYGIPGRVLTDIRPQFTSKFFSMVCAELGIETLTTSEYNSHCNGQVERFNRTLKSRLVHYVAEHENTGIVLSTG